MDKKTGTYCTRCGVVSTNPEAKICFYKDCGGEMKPNKPPFKGLGVQNRR